MSEDSQEHLKAEEWWGRFTHQLLIAPLETTVMKRVFLAQEKKPFEKYLGI